MAAADHIERTPHSFAYSMGNIPSTPNNGGGGGFGSSCGCALGWIAAFAGFPATSNNSGYLAALPLLGIGEGNPFEFYRKFETILGFDLQHMSGFATDGQRQLIAAALRLYALRFHTPLDIGNLHAPRPQLRERGFQIPEPAQAVDPLGMVTVNVHIESPRRMAEDLSDLFQRWVSPPGELDAGRTVTHNRFYRWAGDMTPAETLGSEQMQVTEGMRRQVETIAALAYSTVYPNSWPESEAALRPKREAVDA
jgi:hypothetical protein